MSADRIRDFEMGVLSWIVQVSPQGIHIYLYQREAEGEFIQVTHVPRQQDWIDAVIIKTTTIQS
jgi:hypothetical protein